MKITGIVGTPRNRSVYAIASARIGKNTGLGRLRRTAITKAKTSTTASAIRKIRTLRRKASAISGNESLKTAPLKKASRTSGHPGDVTTTTTMAAKRTTVLTSAIATEREPSAPPRIREPRLPAAASSA
jgi:hypothetical protein